MTDAGRARPVPAVPSPAVVPTPSVATKVGPRARPARPTSARHLTAVRAFAPLKPIAQKARARISKRALERRTKSRVRVLLVVAMLAFGAIGVRLVQLQTVSAPRLRAMAIAQRLRTIPIAGERGSIFDRDGSDLAISVTRDTVYADPKFVSDPGLYAAKLAPAAHVSETDLYHKLLEGKRSGNRYVVVAPTVDNTVVRRVRAVIKKYQLVGVDFQAQPSRSYPSGLLAAPLLGTVGTDQNGVSGLEYAYNSLLSGHSGAITVEVDQSGHEIPRTTRKSDPARRGSDLVLTIDESLQYQVETTLVDQVASQHATSGTAVVIDTHTGDVLAMATVDGEHIGAVQSGPLEHNRAMTDVLEPGSTNKAITVATALQDHLITPSTEFSVPDQVVMGGQVFADDEAHPVEDMNAGQILTQSSNVGAIQIAARLGPVKLDAALRRFGLGSMTAAKFPGQSAGLMLPVSEYHDTGMGSVPIGYGLAVTPLQMLDVYATLANGGVTVPPRLVEATIGPNGRRDDIPLVQGHRIVSKSTASLVTQMLEGVVDSGTGACAAVTGFDVAGKTGTSRIPVSGGYSSSQHMASFVGYAPAEAPRVAAIVVLNSPDDVYGGRASAPVFSEIMSAALRTQRVVPPTPATNPPQWVVANQSAIQQRTSCLVPHGQQLQSMLDGERATEKAAAQRLKQEAYDRAHPNQHKNKKANANGGHGTTTTTVAGGTTTTTTDTATTVTTTRAGPAPTGTVPPTTAPNG